LSHLEIASGLKLFRKDVW